jgi:hypothetical protein
MPLQLIRASGPLITFVDAASESAQRFYRVVLLP